MRSGHHPFPLPCIPGTEVGGRAPSIGILQAVGLMPGETVLITAAVGWIGSLLVQLTRAFGAKTVIGAVGGAAKLSTGSPHVPVGGDAARRGALRGETARRRHRRLWVSGFGDSARPLVIILSRVVSVKARTAGGCSRRSATPSTNAADEGRRGSMPRPRSAPGEKWEPRRPIGVVATLVSCPDRIRNGPCRSRSGRPRPDSGAAVRARSPRCRGTRSGTPPG